MSLLRGKWWQTLLIAAAVGAAAAAAVWFNIHPEYRAEGIVQLKPVVGKIIYQVEDNQMPPMFDAYLEQQVTLLSLGEITKRAQQREPWLEHGYGDDFEAIMKFAGSLEVYRWGKSNMIRVAFEDTNPETALAAVQSMVGAYKEWFRDQETQASRARLEVLTTRQQDLQRTVADAEAQMLQAGGFTSIDQLEHQRVGQEEKLAEIDRQLMQIQLRLDAADIAESTAAAESRPSVMDPSRWSFDPEWQRRAAVTEALRAEWRQTVSRYGENHQIALRLADRVATAEAELEILERQLDQRPLALAQESAVGNPRAVLEGQQRSLKLARDEHVAQVNDLSQKITEAQRHRVRRDETKLLLAEATQRIDALEIEEAGGSRLEVISHGQVDAIPVNAGQQKKMAAAAGLGAGGAVVALMLLIGWMDSRLLSSRDTSFRLSGTHLLGVLPDLSADGHSPTDAVGRNLTTQAFLHLRQLLPVEKGQIYTITSGRSGSGKTTVCHGLGRAFSQSGRQTLLIDADMVGAGLSALVRAERLEQASSDRIPIRDFAAESGLLAAIGGRPLEDCVTPLQPGCDVLTLGPAGAGDPATDALDGIRRVIEAARDRYDVILIDTGPVPGSVETIAAARESTGVLFIASRGDRATTVNAALDYLDRVADKPVSLIFNRAPESDRSLTALTSSLDRQSRGQHARPA
jgi:Mrp family chromosome partitioning ATPase/uncharacterized protein involved in exopolysaccharide biosynthesis